MTTGWHFGLPDDSTGRHFGILDDFTGWHFGHRMFLVGRHCGLQSRTSQALGGLLCADGIEAPARSFTILTQSYARMAFTPPIEFYILFGVVYSLFHNYIRASVDEMLQRQKKNKKFGAGKIFGTRTGEVER